MVANTDLCLDVHTLKLKFDPYYPLHPAPSLLLPSLAPFTLGIGTSFHFNSDIIQTTYIGTSNTNSEFWTPISTSKCLDISCFSVSVLPIPPVCYSIEPIRHLGLLLGRKSWWVKWYGPHHCFKHLTPHPHHQQTLEPPPTPLPSNPVQMDMASVGIGEVGAFRWRFWCREEL